MSTNTLTVVGNLTADPELRFTPAGAAVANFTIAQTPRTFDRDKNEWKDGATNWFRCTVWRDLAENIAESLTKGTEVIVIGKINTRSYKTKEGEDRTVQEIEVEYAGPSLKWATATVKRVNRKSDSNQGNARSQSQTQAAPSNQSDYNDEPPF